MKRFSIFLLCCILALALSGLSCTPDATLEISTTELDDGIMIENVGNVDCLVFVSSFDSEQQFELSFGSDRAGSFDIGVMEFVEPSPEQVTFETYENKEYGYSIEYPEDWQLYYKQQGVNGFQGPRKEGYYISVNIEVEELAEPMTAQEYAELDEEQLETALLYNKVEEYQTTINAEPAVVRVFTRVGRGLPVRVKTKQVYLTNDNMTYIIRCFALRTTYDEANDKYFEHMVQSFKFIEIEEEEGGGSVGTGVGLIIGGLLAIFLEIGVFRGRIRLLGLGIPWFLAIGLTLLGVGIYYIISA